MSSPPFVAATEIAWHPAAPGADRQVLTYTPALMLVRVRFAAGAVGELHHHPHRQVSYVAEGTFDVEVEGTRRVLHAGDSFIVEPDVPHGVVALEAGMLIDVFTPMRETFLTPAPSPPPP